MDVVDTRTAIVGEVRVGLGILSLRNEPEIMDRCFLNDPDVLRSSCVLAGKHVERNEVYELGSCMREMS